MRLPERSSRKRRAGPYVTVHLATSFLGPVRIGDLLGWTATSSRPHAAWPSWRARLFVAAEIVATANLVFKAMRAESDFDNRTRYPIRSDYRALFRIGFFRNRNPLFADARLTPYPASALLCLAMNSAIRRAGSPEA